MVIPPLRSGANLDLAHQGGYTALLLAASNDHAEVVVLSANAGTDINHQERTEGNSGLDWARPNNHSEIVALISAGWTPDPNFHQPRRAAEQRPATPQREVLRCQISGIM